MITLIIVSTLTFITGFVAGVKNSQSSKVAKAKTIIDTIKSK